MDRSTENAPLPYARSISIGSIRGVRAGSHLPLAVFAGVLGFGLMGFGGYGPTRTLVMATGIWLAWLFTPRPWVRPPFGIKVALCVLGIGVVAVAGVHGWPRSAIGPASTLIVAGGSFFVVSVLIARGEVEGVLRALAWSGGIVAITGLFGVAFHIEPWARLATGVWRVASTLGYANAAGAVLALSLIAAMLLAARSKSVVDRALVFTLATGVVLTLSRGALIALFVGGIAGFALGARPVIRSAVQPLMGAGIAIIGAIPTVASDTPQPWSMGAAFTLGALVGLAPSHAFLHSSKTRSIRRYLLIGLPFILAIAMYVLAPFAGDTFDRFRDSRLDLAGEGRLRNWVDQWNDSLESPFTGHGFKTYLPSEASQFAHNEYLQSFHDGGALGVFAILVAFGAFSVTVFTSAVRRRDPMTWGIATSACLVFAAHSGVDFLWRYPVVVLLAFTWLAVAVGNREGRAT